MQYILKNDKYLQLFINEKKLNYISKCYDYLIYIFQYFMGA
jgi:hypothetical protein